jgi:hypothetical protein
MLTLVDVKERLGHYDEVTLLEILDISSEDLLDRFEDFIEEQYEELAEELDDVGYRPDEVG